MWDYWNGATRRDLISISSMMNVETEVVILNEGYRRFNYLPFKVHNNVVYLAGQLAKENGLVKNLGRVNEQISVFEAERQMKICAQHAFSCHAVFLKSGIVAKKIVCPVSLNDTSRSGNIAP